MEGELHYMRKGFAASQGFLSNAGTATSIVYRFYTLRPTEHNCAFLPLYHGI